ncbi:MAG: hypothetical protein QXP29_07165 [Candidatus Nezhaarchaeales archaeon]|uniref:hypothetical protein n=1 Tax=Thermofilum sp. TaxID=1961369 RepID=UPI0031667DCF
MDGGSNSYFTGFAFFGLFFIGFAVYYAFKMDLNGFMTWLFAGLALFGLYYFLNAMVALLNLLARISDGIDDVATLIESCVCHSRGDGDEGVVNSVVDDPESGHDRYIV